MSSRLRVLPLLALLATGCKPQEPDIAPKDRAEGLYLQANAQYLQGKFDEALLSFAEVRKLSPNDPRLPAAVGEVYLSMGKLDEATKEYEAALQLDSKRATNWSRLGFIHAQQGKSDKALPELNKAVELNPRDFNAHEQIAELHLKHGEVEDAVRHFTLAAEAAPDTLKAGLYQRCVDVLSEKGRHEELLALLQKITSGGVRAPELLSVLGDEQVRAGQLTEAIATYREAASKSPKDATLLELVAELHRRLHQPEEAAAAYRESLKVKNRATVHVALARMAMEKLDRAGADKELSLALDAASGEERELDELASLLVDLDRKADALRILASLAAEPGRAKDVDFQLRTARLAQALKDTAVMTSACARVTAAAAPTATPAGPKGKTVPAKGTTGPAPKCP